jgi:signal transduction histidine kinase
MRVRAVLSPLRSVATVRGGVFCLLGGLVLAAYLILGMGFVQMYADPTMPAAAVTVLVTVTTVIALTPPFLVPVRTLEIVAARALLGADLPDPVEDPSSSTRLRAALWYLVHVLLGGATTFVLITLVPLAVLLLLRRLTPVPLLESQFGVLNDLGLGPAIAVGVVFLVVPAYGFAGAGALLRRLAVPLLGPSAADRIAQLEAQRRNLAARNRLARELHDSVGHALTVTTLQATAAVRAFDRDPEFVRSALAAIEETGRAAAADLDRVLGLLREDGATGADREASRAPAPTLADVPQLVAEARRTGRTISLHLPDAMPELAPVLSREAYAVVREGVTNALRHGSDPVAVRLTRDDAGAVVIEVTNAGGTGSGTRAEGGRGLAGLRERVDLLGGRMDAAPTTTGWRLCVVLPVHEGKEER